MSTTEQDPITEFQKHIDFCKSVSLNTYDLHYSKDECNMYAFAAGLPPGVNSVKYFTYHELSKKNRIAVGRESDGFHTINLTPYPKSVISRVTLYVNRNGTYTPVKVIDNPTSTFSFYDHQLQFYTFHRCGVFIL